MSTKAVRAARLRLALILGLLASLVGGLGNLADNTAAAAQDFADPAYTNVWNRTDKQVANGSLSRTFLWGPEPFTPGLQEDYAEAPGGKRLVQYFDKSRMEITNPAGDKTSPYFVTNGLIARDMMIGKIQLGDNKFEDREPSTIGVAGDVDDTNGPTYKVLGTLTNAAGDAGAGAVGKALDRAGTIRDAGPEFGKYNTIYAKFEPTTNHNIAKPFWDFLNQTVQVLDSGGQVITGRLFDPVYYATGLPITEAYWARVKVAGVVKDVLVQAFERRVLTFTPDNPEAYRVEMGNVGRHYYDWRYNFKPTPKPTPPPPVNTATCDNTPIGVNGAYSALKCGPAGMNVLGLVAMQANELVSVNLVTVSNVAIQLSDRKADANGLTIVSIITYPDTPQGRYTIKFKGKTSGKEAEAYFFLLPAVSAPTIIVTPDPGKLDQPVFLVAIGFAAETPLRFNIRNPDSKSGDADQLINTTLGGGRTVFFVANKGFPSDLQKEGKWFVSAVDTKNEKLYATANFTLKK